MVFLVLRRIFPPVSGWLVMVRTGNIYGGGAIHQQAVRDSVSLPPNLSLLLWSSAHMFSLLYGCLNSGADLLSR